MKMTLIQYPITEDGNSNWERVKKLIAKAHNQNPDVIVLPEMWLGGPKTGADIVFWKKFYLGVLEEMLNFSLKKRTVYVFSQLECSGGKNYNTLYAVLNGRIIAKYRKIHLFSYGGETKIFSPGRNSPQPPLKLRGGAKVNFVICYDIRFPELIRKMTFDGMKILFVCAQWPAPRREHWLTLLRARAIENQIFVVAVNRLGKKDKLEFCGDSIVFDPWGNRLVPVSLSHNIQTVKIDFRLQEKIRKTYPFLKERRIK